MLSPFPPFTVKIPKIFSVSFPIFLKIAAALLKELFIGLTTLPRYMVNNKTGDTYQDRGPDSSTLGSKEIRVYPKE
jgi:hypothetical protein